MEFLARAILAIGIGWLVAVGLLWLLQERLLYPAPSREIPAPEGFERRILEGAEGRLPILVGPPGPAGAVLVWFHGNGDRLGADVAVAQAARAAGHGVVLAAYPGYPGAEGRPSRPRIRAAADLVLAQAEAFGRPVVLGGFSLGSAVAADLAARRGTAGLILVGPPSPIAAAAAHRFPVVPGPLLRRLLRDDWSPLEDAGRLAPGTPRLVALADPDPVVPAAQSRRVAEALGVVPIVIEDGGHAGLVQAVAARDAVALLARAAGAP